MRRIRRERLSSCGWHQAQPVHPDAYLRDLAQWAGWLAGYGIPLLEADETPLL
jgi:hypothetical protein